MEQILAENLLRLRKARGFRTQEAFAQAAEIPFRTYQDAERGKSWPQKRTLEAIAAALGVEERELFRDPSAGDSSTRARLVEIIFSMNEAQVTALFQVATGMTTPGALDRLKSLLQDNEGLKKLSKG